MNWLRTASNCSEVHSFFCNDLSTFILLAWSTIVQNVINVCKTKKQYICTSKKSGISIYLCLSMPTDAYLFLCMPFYAYLCLSMPFYVFLCLSIYAYLYMPIYLCLSIYAYLCLSMPIYICLPIYAYLSMPIYLCLSIYAHLCQSIKNACIKTPEQIQIGNLKSRIIARL